MHLFERDIYPFTFIPIYHNHAETLGSVVAGDFLQSILNYLTPLEISSGLYFTLPYVVVIIKILYILYIL